jgi:hypothetical protein
MKLDPFAIVFFFFNADKFNIEMPFFVSMYINGCRVFAGDGG